MDIGQLQDKIQRNLETKLNQMMKTIGTRTNTFSRIGLQSVTNTEADKDMD